MSFYNPKFHKEKAYYGVEGIPQIESENRFITTDLFWAAFCRARGLTLTKIQHTNSPNSKMIEVVLEGKNAHAIAQGFLTNESVPIKDFVDLFKPLRDDVLRFRNESHDR